ncbi:MAG: S8 family serine peptidase, partial [Myxococcota bacterium]
MVRLAVTSVAVAALVSACSGTSIEETGGNKEALGGFSSETGRYVIIFEEDPVPTYDGSTPGFQATRTDGQRLQANDAAVTSYRRYLLGNQRTMLNDLGTRWGAIDIDETFQLAVNGAVVTMSEQTAAGVASSPDVKAIYPDEIVYPTTASSIEMIGAANVHLGVNQDAPFQGEGMVVGIIDSGINPRHPSFAATGGDGYTVQAPADLQGYLGDCVESPELCNDKLIGMYSFVGEDPVNDVEGQPSSIDTSGHGSHVASTAAGNVLFDTPLLDAEGNPGPLSFNVVSGVAPHANIINYKVCTVGCSTAAIVSAVEQAIEDGVDALNHSISSGAGSPWNSAQGLAFLNARASGIFVANSAGNSGPAPGTAEAGGNAPWAAAVAASSHDRAFTEKTIGGFSGGATPLNGDFVGRSVSDGVGGPIVYAGDFSNGVDETPELCLVPFPAGTFNGEIVVCDRGQIARVAKGINVRDGGAGGLVLVNVEGGADSVNDDPHVLPAIHLDAVSGAELKTWLAAGADHFANISGGVSITRDASLGDEVIGFSSRGPYTGFDILAPSIAAPGVAIFAAGA